MTDLADTPAYRKFNDETRRLVRDGEVPDPDRALIRANRLLDESRQHPEDRALASAAAQAAAIAGLVTRQRCFACQGPDAHPLPIPGQDATECAWICSKCEQGNAGRMSFRVA
jgi:hypothetical protein